MLYGEALFHGGIGVMCAAAGLGALFALLFAVTGKRLRTMLDAKYGETRRK